MAKIVFLGAGSTVFAKNILGDSLRAPALRDARIALYDIDAKRLRESKTLMDALNANINDSRAAITAHWGVSQRKEALRGAHYVVNAIQVGGYKPSTIIDFEIPKKYGLRQTIADTLGIGGIFRALRTIPVMLDFARDMREVCPDAWFLNYTNPMSMLSGAMIRGGGVKTVGLCHSVQGCARGLCRQLGLDPDKMPGFRWEAAGVNHQAWLLSVRDGKKDLYPEIKKRAAVLVARERRRKAPRKGMGWDKHRDLVRLHLMEQCGYYVTESSEHNAEYYPWYIKSRYPDLIEEFNIPLDEYPHRCEGQIQSWKEQAKAVVHDRKIDHRRGGEYGSYIMEAMETNVPAKIYGNVLNNGIIPNLPAKACVEVPCLVDRNGVQPLGVGDLPEPCAALNRVSVNVQLLAIEAALTLRKEHIYQAAMLDPHTAAELSIDDIRRMVDDLVKAHGKRLPKFR